MQKGRLSINPADLIPDISELTDEDLGRIFRLWDGVWSSQTKALAARFGTADIDLNPSWASTPQFWRCPCCERYKPDLVRRSPSGVLLCHLEWHHDHLRDRGKAILRACNPRRDGPEGLATARAIETCKNLLERFYPALVCKDCNAAEGEAKTRLKGVVHPDFSFSPMEIRSFIVVTPNKPHVVEIEKARAAWKAVQPDFEDLLGFAETLAKRIAQGHHQKSGVPPWYANGPSGTEILRCLLETNEGELKTYELAIALANRSVKRQGTGSAPPKRRRAETPTEAEYAAFDARQDETTQWRRAPSDWRCAACTRDRRQIIRRSNKGTWTGQLHQFSEYLPEIDPTALWQRSADVVEDLIFGDHHVLLVCGDCRHIITDVKTRAPDLTEDHFTIADLRELVANASPNVRHDYDLEAAITSARNGTAHRAAVDEYRHHRSKALDVRYQVDRIQRRDLCSVDEALHILAWDTSYTDEENQAWEEKLRWLRDQSDRYVPAEPKQTS